MSVALTEQQVRDRTKTVTRRLGWKFLKPGDTLTLCRKVMGRKKDEPLVRICDVTVVSVEREPLDFIEDCPVRYADGRSEMALEGFPNMTAYEFVDFFCTHMKCCPDTEVTRISWEYQDKGDET